MRFKMVHSNTKDAKTRVLQSQVCYVRTIHFSTLKGKRHPSILFSMFLCFPTENENMAPWTTDHKRGNIDFGILALTPQPLHPPKPTWKVCSSLKQFWLNPYAIWPRYISTFEKIYNSFEHRALWRLFPNTFKSIKGSTWTQYFVFRVSS